MNDTTAAALQDLLHAGRALTGMYDDAIGRLGSDNASALSEIADEHRHHGELLAQTLQDADMDRVEAGEDAVSLMAQHARLVRSASDESSILETLALAEHTTSLLCAIAERSELPEEIDEVIADQHASERLHASVIADRVAGSTGLTDSHAVACMTGGITDDRNPDDFE